MSLKGIEAVLAVAPGLTGAARADAAGNVLEIAGQLDGEALCAVATMSRAPLEKAAELLGLGALRDWSFSYAQGALYVHHAGGAAGLRLAAGEAERSPLADEGMVAVQGGPTKSPETVMKKLGQALGDRP